MKRTSLKKDDFLQIKDRGFVHYGGNQNWFYPNQIGVQGGCGVIAAANILAYLALTSPHLRDLYGYALEPIKKNDFLKHMGDVYPFVTPRRVMKPFAGRTMRNGKRIPITLGVMTLREFARGVRAFGRDRGVTLDSYRITGTCNPKKATTFVKEGLLNNSPIALLNYANTSLAAVPYMTYKGIRKEASFKWHWVTITAIEENLETGAVKVEVSSWGGKATLDLTDMVTDAGFGGMIYFFEKQK
jgi:hypothetical protein